MSVLFLLGLKWKRAKKKGEQEGNNGCICSFWHHKYPSNMANAYGFTWKFDDSKITQIQEIYVCNLIKIKKSCHLSGDRIFFFIK